MEQENLKSCSRPPWEEADGVGTAVLAEILSPELPWDSVTHRAGTRRSPSTGSGMSGPSAAFQTRILTGHSHNCFAGRSSLRKHSGGLGLGGGHGVCARARPEVTTTLGLPVQHYPCTRHLLIPKMTITTLWNCHLNRQTPRLLPAGSAASPPSRTEKFPLPKPRHCACVALPSAVGGRGDTAQGHCSE